MRLKPEFRKHAGKGIMSSDLPCGLHGIYENEVLTVSTIIETTAHFTKHLAWCPCSWVEKVEDTEEEPETLAADGLPIKAGDELWFVDDGCYEAMGVSRSAKQPFRVVKIEGVSVRANSSDEADEAEPWWIRPECLTHAQPDTWERLEEDARKQDFEYWKCETVECEECPAVIDGKCPSKRYMTEFCEDAKCLDIVRRAKAIAGRERGER